MREDVTYATSSLIGWDLAQPLGAGLKIKMSYQYSDSHCIDKMDGLVQERRNSIANALELRLSCTNP